MQKMEGTHRPLKRLPANFCQPRDAPIPHLPTAIWPKGFECVCVCGGGGCKVVKNGGGRNDLFRYVAKISHLFLETHNTELYKILMSM